MKRGIISGDNIFYCKHIVLKSGKLFLVRARKNFQPFGPCGLLWLKSTLLFIAPQKAAPDSKETNGGGCAQENFGYKCRQQARFSRGW